MSRDGEVDSGAETVGPTGATRLGRPASIPSGHEATATPEAPTVAHDRAVPNPGEPRLADRGVDLDELPDVDGRLYSIGMEIGRGGMGRILAARDRKLRRDVVIKVLRAVGHNTRFEREALITARLQHPSIVRVYDAGKLGDEPFYAMEHVRGKSLDRVVAAADDAPARLALLPHVIAIADALAYAHSEGVIHRDLKPANVLVGSFGETVVIDWGLAKDLRRTEPDSIDPERNAPQLGSLGASPPSLSGELTIAGAVMGTPSYMPPEQARGEPADERSDVYAIGAILYTVLAGTPPITGDRALDDARAGGFAPLRERAPETPPELVTIVEHAMAFDPADRYATARELAEDLRRFTTGKLVARHSYSRGELIRRWVRRYRAAVVVVAATLTVLGIVSAIGVRRLANERDRAHEDAALATTALREAEDRSDSLVLHQADRALANDPSHAIAWLQRLSARGLARPRARELADQAAGRGIAFELAGPRGDLEHLVVVDPASAYTASHDGHVWRWQLSAWRGDDLEGHAGPIEAFALSADGFWLATGGADRAVRVWNLDKVESRILAGHTGAVRGVAFSPDGNTVASTSEDGTLWLWTASTGAGLAVVRDAQPLGPVVWSLDGKRLWTGTHDGRVLEYDVTAGKLVAAPLRPHTATLRVLVLSPDGTRLASGGADGASFVWSIADRRPRRLGTHADAVSDLVWSPDGKRLVTAGGDALVQVHDFAAGKTYSLEGGGSGVRDLAISHDGFWVAAAGIDGKVRLWPIAGGAPRTLAGHRAPVTAVAFTPDGAKLLSASEDDRLRLWPLAPPPPAPSGAALAHWLVARTNLAVAPP